MPYNKSVDLYCAWRLHPCPGYLTTSYIFDTHGGRKAHIYSIVGVKFLVFLLHRFTKVFCSVNVYEDLVFGHFGKVGVELEVSKYKNLYAICVLVPI